MPSKPREWTRTDLERLPDDGNRYEVVRGQLFVTPAPAVRHQRLVLALADRLRPYVKAMTLGEVDQAPSAVVFEGNEVQPDIVVRERVFPPPGKWEEMPIPFLVVEVLSATTRRRDLVDKRSLYLDAGVAEYWIVDGAKRSIRVVRHDIDHMVTDTLRWHTDGAPDALVLDLPALFREALG